MALALTGVAATSATTTDIHNKTTPQEALLASSSHFSHTSTQQHAAPATAKGVAANQKGSGGVRNSHKALPEASPEAPSGGALGLGPSSPVGLHCFVNTTVVGLPPPNRHVPSMNCHAVLCRSAFKQCMQSRPQWPLTFNGPFHRDFFSRFVKCTTEKVA
jgi:hypothetical protein